MKLAKSSSSLSLKAEAIFRLKPRAMNGHKLYNRWKGAIEIGTRHNNYIEKAQEEEEEEEKPRSTEVEEDEGTQQRFEMDERRSKRNVKRAILCQF